jgi:hypothetical protein
MSVLSGQELDIFKGMVTTAQNVSMYSYEVAVKGMVVDGIATLICGLLSVIITIYCGYRFMKWSEKEGDGSVTCAVIGIIVVLVVSMIVTSVVIHDPFMKIFAPEYTVIKQLMEAAVNVVK